MFLDRFYVPRVFKSHQTDPYTIEFDITQVTKEQRNSYMAAMRARRAALVAHLCGKQSKKRKKRILGKIPKGYPVHSMAISEIKKKGFEAIVGTWFR